jgi:hypothetical protein
MFISILKNPDEDSGIAHKFFGSNELMQIALGPNCPFACGRFISIDSHGFP